MKYIMLLLFVTTILSVQAQKKFTISGYVKEAGSAETLMGASIAIPAVRAGTISNNYGFYSITLNEGIYEFVVTYVGYKPKAFSVTLDKSIELDLILDPANALSEVVITGSKKMQRLADETRMSVIEIPIEQIKDIPALLGEKDVLKVIQLLPGVQKGSEGSAGIYVRGGGPDQNLIILDDAIVYNAYHLFGFFSLFNGDALKSVELTKGGFPARYGGRLSSVIEMNMKEGNKEKLHGEAGIGLIASRLLLEGPIVKGKSSFLISGRRTYVDVLSLPFQTGDTKAGYYFYDLNAKANYEINRKNRIYLSGYFGRDKFYARGKYEQSSSDFGLGWGNSTATFRWNHLYNNKLFANTSLIFSNFLFNTYEENKSNGNTFSLNYSSGITDFSIKHDLDFRPNPNHNIRAGFNLIYHVFVPSAIVTKNDYSGQNQNVKSNVVSMENAIYIEDDMKLGSRLKLNPGLRISHFNSQNTNYVLPEPRLNMAYKIKSDLAIKTSYAVMNQYVHLLSNSGLGLPTDLWVPSSTNLKPTKGWQLAAGLAKDFVEKEFSVSIEGYYKESKNIIAYKDGASFLDLGPGNNNTNKGSYAWEQNIVAGKGWSYGGEFLLQKKTGLLTGWVGYTLSWTQMQFDALNFGQKFWARYDRRHDISVVCIYKIREENTEHGAIKLSVVWVYGTGNAITLPVAEYNSPVHNPGPGSNMGFNGNTVSQYTGRNQFRMGAYHRMDIGIQLTKKMKYYLRTWEFSVYNLYNRANPYFYYIESSFDGINTKRTLTQISLFPLIPSISYNIKF
ncbi:MAG: TonB-dependent receptor [Bacteroidia bacterium]|nr:TonB-dependent receptor [Bacteroidia bacterium]